MTLSTRFELVRDPEGHGPALFLKGDWFFVGVSNGNNTGWGEGSLSGDDKGCERTVRELLDLIPVSDLSIDVITVFRERIARRVDSFVAATAASALEQALHELIALRAGVPVWRLFVTSPAQTELMAYATINRALTTRDSADYIAIVELARGRGFTEIKCAPFEQVVPNCDAVAAAQDGLAMLRLLRDRFPDVGIRVDCHERFPQDAFFEILPALDELGLAWIEAPCPIGPVYVEIRERAATPIAAGELFFGSQTFAEICEKGWADVVMPDVKHIGGIGPVLDVCELASRTGVEVSLHNASGPVATAASIHCGAISSAVTSVEVALRRGANPNERLLDGRGVFSVPDGPGWGDGSDLDFSLTDE